MDIEEGKLWISIKYEVAIHLCACSCKTKTVTPFKLVNTDNNKFYWQLVDNNGIISLYNSILNNDCKAHYYIKDNRINWCE